MADQIHVNESHGPSVLSAVGPSAASKKHVHSLRGMSILWRKDALDAECLADGTTSTPIEREQQRVQFATTLHEPRAIDSDGGATGPLVPTAREEESKTNRSNVCGMSTMRVRTSESVVRTGLDVAGLLGAVGGRDVEPIRAVAELVVDPSALRNVLASVGGDISRPARIARDVARGP